jgi:hypothetical protein
VFQRRPDPGRQCIGIRPTLCCARRFLAIPQLCPGAGRTLSFVRELAAGLRRLGKTDGVACTAQHVQVHLLHRLQVKGGVGLCGVDEEGPQRIGFAFGTRCSSAISQNQSGLMDIWAAFRLVLVQVKCTAAPVFVQSFVYACGSASTLAKVSRDEFEAWPPTCLTLAMPLTLRFFLALLPNRIL